MMSDTWRALVGSRSLSKEPAVRTHFQVWESDFKINEGGTLTFSQCKIFINVIIPLSVWCWIYITSRSALGIFMPWIWKITGVTEVGVKQRKKTSFLKFYALQKNPILHQYFGLVFQLKYLKIFKTEATLRMICFHRLYLEYKCLSALIFPLVFNIYM